MPHGPQTADPKPLTPLTVGSPPTPIPPQVHFTAECRFKECVFENYHVLYASALYRKRRSGRAWYLGLDRHGRPMAGHRVRKDKAAAHFLPQLLEGMGAAMGLRGAVMGRKGAVMGLGWGDGGHLWGWEGAVWLNDGICGAEMCAMGPMGRC